jgi:hypothetical protein
MRVALSVLLFAVSASAQGLASRPEQVDETRPNSWGVNHE